MSDRWMQAEEDAMEARALRQAVEYFRDADPKQLKANEDDLREAFHELCRLLVWGEILP